MIILLNGPLGIGKTTLAEALMERVQQCVMLDGDHLLAANPSPFSAPPPALTEDTVRMYLLPTA